MRTDSLNKLLLILLFIVAPTVTNAGGLLDLGTAEHEFIYDRLERRDALTVDHFSYQLGPYTTENSQFDFEPFEELGTLQPDEIRLFSHLAEDFVAKRNASPETFENISIGLAAQPHERLFIHACFRLDERRAQEDTYTGKKWRGLAGQFENAYVRYTRGRFEATLGRFASFWGPRNSMALAGNVSMDGLGYRFRWGRLIFSYRLARLDGLSPDRDGVDQFENRFFAGHRLDVRLADWLNLALFETAIFGGPGRQVDMYYLNPIIFYHASQLNHDMDDNTFVGFDFSIKPKPGVKLYGQLLVDDLQVDDREQSDQEPSQLGLIVGAYLADILNNIDLKTEYSRVNNWTFNQVNPRNRYTYDDQLIGGALGNDYDLLATTVTHWHSNQLAFLASVRHMRQGQGSPTAEWSTPWMLAAGNYDEPFPTGTVEITTTAAVGFKAFFFDHVFASLESGINWIDNFEHMDGASRRQPYVKLFISSFVSKSIGVD